MSLLHIKNVVVSLRHSAYIYYGNKIVTMKIDDIRKENSLLSITLFLNSSSSSSSFTSSLLSMPIYVQVYGSQMVAEIDLHSIAIKTMKE